ncbi:hypothetical protein PoB_000805200 [Plakobranchus ocellatus]|uniref:Uncharacterized protein n=1 Tax=Plakobranchus ocellatus TaxID=259542 RepID=A0AAV3YH51_9GAST|nr:hypothetical protein PoB_000805200 [Plakobranchus ocellatus]
MQGFPGEVGGTEDSETAVISAGTLLSRVRAPPLAPLQVGRPESLRAPYCGHTAVYSGRKPALWLKAPQCHLISSDPKRDNCSHSQLLRSLKTAISLISPLLNVTFYTTFFTQIVICVSYQTARKFENYRAM